MTRDEAIKTLMKYQGDHDPERSGHWIDALDALGILKLDAPKDDGFHKLITEMGYHPQGSVAGDIKNALRSGGLKLVEK